MRTRNAIRAASVLVGILMAGCGVSRTTHEAVAAELDTCQGERAAFAAQRSDQARRLEELETTLATERATAEEKLQASKEELEALRKQRKELDRQLEEFQSLTERFKEMIAADDLAIYVRRGRMIVALPSGVLFDSGKAELTPRGLKTLEAVAGTLKELGDRRLLVAGHTDNEPIRGSGFEDNWHLSTARALTVTRFLVGQGMKPESLAAVGYGEHDPVRSNKTKEGRRRNRRIELILEPRIPDFSKLPELGSDDDAPRGTSASGR